MRKINKIMVILPYIYIYYSPFIKSIIHY